MLYDYILKNYEKDEPIFLSELPGDSRDYVRQKMKKLVEVCSNEATTKQRKLCIDGRNLIVYKPITEITKENQTALQFLDLMTTIDKYSEISGNLLRMKLKEFVNILNVDFSIVKRYIALFPDRVYRNIYQGGLMGELV